MKRAAFAIAAVLLLQTPVRGQEAPRPAVEVTAAGAAEALTAMGDRVRSLESRFPVAVRWTVVDAIDVRAVVAPREAGDAAFARVWLDMSDPERAVLFIANAGHDRFLVRVVPVGDGYGELTRESLATVVESTIDALLAGGQIGVDRSAAVRELETQTGTQLAPPEAAPPPAVVTLEPAPARESAPAQPAMPGPSLLVAAGYRVDAISDGPALRHGAQLTLAWSPGFDTAFDLLLGVAAQYCAPFSLGDGGRRMTEQGGGARAAIGATGHPSRTLVWQAGLGAGVEILRVEPAIAADTGLEAAEPFSVTAPVATAFVTGSLRPTPFIDLALGVGLDVALSGPHFDVQRESSRAALITPWRLHPYALVGIGMPFDLGGGTR